MEEYDDMGNVRINGEEISNNADTEKWSTEDLTIGRKLSVGDTISWDDATYNVLRGK